MQIDINDSSKTVVIWLSNAEQANEKYKLPLQEIFQTYKNKKYTVAVFKSGTEDLYENTLELLKFNKRRSAETAVKRNKNS